MFHDNFLVYRYIKWISSIKTILGEWSKKIHEERISYSSVTRYKKNIRVLHNISSEVLLQESVPEYHYLKSIISDFEKEWFSLTSSVVKNHPFVKNINCKLHELLKSYDVEVPEDKLELVLENVLDSNLYKEMSCIEVSQNIQLSKRFIGFTLYLHEECTLVDLKTLCTDYKKFENKFLPDNIRGLVYFSLEKSKLFQSYISKKLKLDLPFRSSLYSINTEATSLMSAEDFNQVLTVALKSINELILGSFTYSEIVSCHEDFLSDNNSLFNEIHILKRYVVGFKFSSKFQEGLENAESMLQLIQCSPNVISLCNILKNFEAFKDIDLAPPDLFEIANDMQSKKSETMTVFQAKLTMEKIKNILGITEGLDCLKILPSISQSKEFYSFLYDQKYVGKDGQKRFKQKYDLITAQLQHQAYNDTVLNHLWVAYTLMTPFLEPSSLKELVNEIKSISKGKSQLMTVNSNLTTIFIWFSKAEVR